MKKCKTYQQRLGKLLVPAAFSAALLTTPALQAAPMYTITDLGDLLGGLNESRAIGINDRGQVVGQSSAATGTRGFLWQNGVMTDLGDLEGGFDDSRAHAVNNNGQVVGTSWATTGQRAFLWDSVSGMTDLGILRVGTGSSHASGINDIGQVVGTARSAAGNPAFLYQNGVMSNIGDLPGGGVLAQAFDINENSQVVGVSSTTFEFTGDHAFLWQNGVMTDLGGLPDGDGFSLASAINNNGQVVGRSSLATGEERAVLWQDGTITNLGGLSDVSAYSGAVDINDVGQVVGYGDLSGLSHAFVWDAVHGMRDLNGFITTAGGWLLQSASAINSSGQIVGTGVLDGFTRGFLLDPVMGTMVNNPLLPVTDPLDGSFDFTFEADLAGVGEPIYIDPLIAIGYDYIVESGPNIATVLLPTILSDDGLYDIYLWDGDGFDIFAGIAEDGVAFDFTALASVGAGGVDQFRVRGIDPAAMLDPGNDRAFVTGLTFVGGGTVSMSQTPVTFDTDAVNPGPTDVPEPMTLSLLGAGLGGLAWARRRSRTAK